LLHQIEDAGQGELKGVELRLDPPELGKVNVRISLAGDEVRVVFSAAQGGAREAIEGALPRLREQLEAIGLTLQDAQVGDQDRKDSRQDRSVNEAAESADLEGELGAEPIVKKPSERRLDLLA
jgi:flagellar hook-length control protein FliK